MDYIYRPSEVKHNLKICLRSIIKIDRTCSLKLCMLSYVSIYEVKYVQYLGVLIGSQLSFKYHITKKSKRNRYFK